MKVMASFDAKVYIPQFLVNFFAKRVTTKILRMIEATARKIHEDPVNNLHAQVGEGRCM